MSMRVPIAALAALILAAPAMAQTVQQRFDAATAKLDAKDPAGALADLDALEAYLLSLPKRSDTNLALTRVMRAEVLVELGRGLEAKAAVVAALDGPGLAKPELEHIRDNARLLRARIHEGELEAADARRVFLQVAADSKLPMTRAVALIGAARSVMFLDAAAALRHIDEALAIAERDPAVGKEQLATVLGLKGRILINGGRDAEARALLVKAVDLTGGLTSRANLNEAVLRADAAIAMLRLGQDEAARRYLAYTGAGHSPEPLDPPIEHPLPPCGGEGDLRPDDWAVIEFTVLEDGRVVTPRPVFASRQGEMAYVFARAVGDWSWNPENAAKVKLFYRFAARAEVRCSNTAARPSLMNEFQQAAADWLAAQGAPMQLEGASAERAVLLRQQLDALPAGDRSARRLAIVAELAGNPIVPAETARDHAAEAVALARALNAPAPALFAFAVRDAVASVPRSASSRGHAGRVATAYKALLDRPEFAEPRIRATIQTMMAGALASAGRRDEEMAALRQVADDSSLADRDPLKVAALIAFANAHAARKDMAAASAAYARTGLSARQCALLDNGPVLSASGHGTFPQDVLNWGFDGWTLLEYDVAADGRTRGSRAVAAFPPRLFNQATESLARTVRYRVSYRPEGDLACTAMQRRVRFRFGY
jgi:SAM-dependent methyltransferase